MAVKISKGDKTAILFGASGLVGSHCLEQLLISPIYSKVISFGRKEIEIEHDKLQQEIIDFDRLPDYLRLIDGDDLFCCLGTTIKKAGSKESFYKVDFTYVSWIAKLAASNQVPQMILVSALGAHIKSPFFYNRVKGKLESVIQEMDFWGLHILRPSLLLGEREEFRLLESVAGFLTKQLNRLNDTTLGNYQPIDAAVVAKAMIKSAQGIKGGVFIYSSEEIRKMDNENLLLE